MTDRKVYIERGALLEYLGADSEDDLQPVVVMEFVESIPAADVVEVVRCVECNRAIRRTVYDVERLYWCNEHAVCVKPDDYCSCGERKDGADNGNQQ